MAFCPHCGKPVSVGATYCVACGTSLVAAPSVAAPPPTTMAAAAAPPARVRPVGVTILAVLTFIAGGLAAFAAVMMLLGAMMGATFGAAMSDFFPFALPAAMFAMVMLLAAVVVGAVAALLLFTGSGTLNGRPWAWVAHLVWTGLNALGGLSSLAQGEYSAIVGLAIAGLVIWYLFTPEVKAWFGRS